MEADFGRDFLETSNKILKTTDRICKIALSLSRIEFKFMDKIHYPCEFEKVW